MKITDNKELLMEIEKYLKAGRFSFSVLTWDDKDKAVTNELIVKFDKDGKPTLNIKNPDGTISSIVTESAQEMKDFLENFIEVSVDRTKNYEPSIWFMLKQDEHGDTGWNKSTISQFYNYVEQNYKNLKPYALQVFANGQKELLMPYVDTKMVFYDLGKIMSGKGVESFDVITKLLFGIISDIKSNIIDVVNGMESNFNDIRSKLEIDNDRQDKEIDTLRKSIMRNKETINNMMESIGGIKDTTDRRLDFKKFTVGGDPHMVYPVRFKLTKGGNEILGGHELFMSVIFLQMESPSRTIVMQIGNMHSTTSPQYYNGVEDQYFVYSHKVLNGANAKHYVYDCKMIGSGDYIVLLRGGTEYTVWTKYVDYLDITNNLQAIEGISPIRDTDTANAYLTDDNILGRDVVRTFSNSVHVVNSVVIGNKFKMGIE